MKCCMELDTVNNVFRKNIEIEPINRFKMAALNLYFVAFFIILRNFPMTILLSA